MKWWMEVRGLVTACDIQPDKSKTEKPKRKTQRGLWILQFGI